MESSAPTVVLVHGAWHGPWVWGEVRRQLELAGVASVAVALPSVGKQGGLVDDVGALSDELDGLTGPFVLVGHSYGGVPISEVAATRSDVVHAVYVCAFVIPVGTSLLDHLGGQPLDWWIIDDDGVNMVPEGPRARFYSECTPAVADDAVARLRPHSVRSSREPLRKAAYGRLPATYVVCERDRGMPVEAQRAMAELAGAETVPLDADHSPMLNHPAELAAILARVARVASGSSANR